MKKFKLLNNDVNFIYLKIIQIIESVMIQLN